MIKEKIITGLSFMILVLILIVGTIIWLVTYPRHRKSYEEFMF